MPARPERMTAGQKLVVGTNVAAMCWFTACVMGVLGPPSLAVRLFFGAIALLILAVATSWVGNWCDERCRRHSQVVEFLGYTVVTIYVACLACFVGAGRDYLHHLPIALALGAMPITETPRNRIVSVCINGAVTYCIFRACDAQDRFQRADIAFGYGTLALVALAPQLSHAILCVSQYTLRPAKFVVDGSLGAVGRQLDRSGRAATLPSGSLSSSTQIPSQPTEDHESQ